MRPVHHRRGTHPANPRNHPDQIRSRGHADDSIDDRVTPHDLWRLWDREFHFTLDAAASVQNAKCPGFYTVDSDGLRQQWSGRVWCNPPYSDIGAWVQKASDEWAAGAAALIVMLLPGNRTEQRWWQRLVEPFRDRGGELTTRFLPHRINFGRPDGSTYKSSAPFGCVLLIWRRAADLGGFAS